MKSFWTNDSNSWNIPDEILVSKTTEILNKFGWFQLRSLIFLSFASFALGMFISSFVFLNIFPPYHCQKNSENVVNSLFNNLIEPLCCSQCKKKFFIKYKGSNNIYIITNQCRNYFSCL